MADTLKIIFSLCHLGLDLVVSENDFLLKPLRFVCKINSQVVRFAGLVHLSFQGT